MRLSPKQGLSQLAVGLHACGDLGRYAVTRRQNRQRVQHRHMLTERQPAIGCRRRLRRKRWRVNARVVCNDAADGLCVPPLVLLHIIIKLCSFGFSHLRPDSSDMRAGSCLQLKRECKFITCRMTFKQQDLQADSPHMPGRWQASQSLTKTTVLLAPRTCWRRRCRAARCRRPR